MVELNSKPTNILIVAVGGENGVPFCGGTAEYYLYDPDGKVVGMGDMIYNFSLHVFYAEVPGSIITRAGAYKIRIIVNDSASAESTLKAVYKYGSFLRLSTNGLNVLNGVLSVKKIGKSFLTLEIGRKIVTLNPGQSIDLNIHGVGATLIVDRIDNGSAVVTLTYPKDIPLEEVIQPQTGKFAILSGETYKAKLTKDEPVEFTELLRESFFGLIKELQHFRIEAPSADVKWFVTIRAGISLSKWIQAGCPLELNEALDALLVWESEPHVVVNWHAEKYRRILFFVEKLAEKSREYVDLITPDMIKPSYFNFDIPGGFWAKLFAERYDEAVDAYVVAASWSLGDVEGVEFNWNEMWNALMNGEIIVSVDFIIKSVTLEFKA